MPSHPLIGLGMRRHMHDPAQWHLGKSWANPFMQEQLLRQDSSGKK